MTALFESHEADLRMLARGKVRDIYEYGPDELLIVTSDRISAFDVILPTPIPGKGRVLTQVSNFWFARTEHVIANHIVDPDPFVADPAREHLVGRSVVVRKAEPLPVEAIVRGYLSGSGRKDYERSGQICGISLPAGLVEGSRLPEPIFTPSTKADVGTHDENVAYEHIIDVLGAELAGRVRDGEPGSLWLRRCLCSRARHHHRRHQVRVRPDRRRADPHRRGHDAGLVTLLAGRRLRPRPGPAELRQAAAARLPRDPGLGQDGPGPGAAGRGRRPDGGALRRSFAPPHGARSGVTA